VGGRRSGAAAQRIRLHSALGEGDASGQYLGEAGDSAQLLINGPLIYAIRVDWPQAARFVNPKDLPHFSCLDARVTGGSATKRVKSAIQFESHGMKTERSAPRRKRSSFDLDETIAAYFANRTVEKTAAYLRSGKSLAGLTDDQLRDTWANECEL
jgi:hypothetical protein